MKRIPVLIVIAMMVCGCSVPALSQEATATVTPLVILQNNRSCGDGLCSGPEDAQNCPQDCSATLSGSNPTEEAVQSVVTEPVPAEGVAPASDAPFFFTTMTHMEGNWNDDEVEGVFLKHVEQLRYGMDLASEYGALLTIESEKPFARANVNWNLNIMAEVRDRGFGVGTHCDIGFNEPLMPVEDFANMFRENKTLVDALVGAENNLGCSGGGGVNDWAQAASLAGFKYLDGTVSMHYLSMPMENRPGDIWTDAFIRNGHFHLNAPAEMEKRIYPLEVANALDFNADPNPVIVVLSGELGLISAMAENGREYGGSEPLTDEDYTFDRADVDALVSIIRETEAMRDHSRITKLCAYLPSKLYDAENEETLRYFFEQIQSLENEGVVTWATQRQVYEAYVANP